MIVGLFLVILSDRNKSKETILNPSINIIGAGNLGKTIARLIFSHNVGLIQGICNSSIESSEQAAYFIGQGQAKKINELLPADITFITTPDDQIESCCNKLVESSNLKEGSIVLHCSGSLSSEILRITKKRGCFTASVHPMRSFAKPEISITQYPGTYCAIEGDDKAIATLNKIFTDIGSTLYTVNRNKKGSYHAAGVFASNYLVTVCQNAFFCLENAEVEKEMASKIIISLMKSTLNNLEVTLSPEKSLTGPIQRGDINTLKKHLDSLPYTISQLYKILGLATLPIANLPKDKREKIEDLFSKVNLDYCSPKL